MPEPRPLTTLQHGNIVELQRRLGKGNIAFAGWDRRGYPTFQVTDANGQQYITWKPDGPGDRPMMPLRDLTDKELDNLSPLDAEILFDMPYAIPQSIQGGSTHGTASH